MKPVPSELATVIAKGRHRRSREAEESMDALDLVEADVIEVALTGSVHKKTRDPSLEGRYVWTIIGRDRRGRECYMAGKVVRRDDEAIWKIITFHETAG